VPDRHDLVRANAISRFESLYRRHVTSMEERRLIVDTETYPRRPPPFSVLVLS